MAIEVCILGDTLTLQGTLVDDKAPEMARDRRQHWVKYSWSIQTAVHPSPVQD